MISDVARAQDTSSQGFIRRYSSGTVDAVASLLSPQPNIETVLLASPSISLTDLVDMGGAAGEAAEAMRDSGTYDLRALNLLRQKIADGTDVDDQARRTRDARARLNASPAAEDV